MTTIDEVLGKCATRVQFDRNEINRLPLKCYGCHGYPFDARKRGCEDYKPYLLRRTHTYTEQTNNLSAGGDAQNQKLKRGTND